nr:site-specific DNA-methyltransferase [Clostridium chromiireducens]
MEYINNIICKDCINGMKELPDNFIASCITDPPYNYEFIGHKWDNNEIERRKERIKESSSTLVKNIPYGSGLAGGVRNKRWYDKNRENIVEYAEWIEEWGNELYRIMKPGGLVFVFNSTRTIAQVQVALEKVGFYARDILVWRRHSGIPKGLNVAKKLQKMGNEEWQKWEGWHSCFRTEWEAICIVQKPLINNYIETLEKYHVGLFKAKTENGFKSNILENIKRDEKDEFNTHSTVKPKELIKELIDLSVPRYDDNIVLDPFMGSGTTAVAARELGINFIGFEICQEYVDIANRRLKDCNKEEKIENHKNTISNCNKENIEQIAIELDK